MPSSCRQLPGHRLSHSGVSPRVTFGAWPAETACGYLNTCESWHLLSYINVPNCPPKLPSRACQETHAGPAPAHKGQAPDTPQTDSPPGSSPAHQVETPPSVAPARYLGAPLAHLLSQPAPSSVFADLCAAFRTEPEARRVRPSPSPPPPGTGHSPGSLAPLQPAPRKDPSTPKPWPAGRLPLYSLAATGTLHPQNWKMTNALERRGPLEPSHAAGGACDMAPLLWKAVWQSSRR